MNLSRRRFIAITAGTAAAGLAPVQAMSAVPARWTGTALGAAADVRLVGLPEMEAASLMRRVRAEIARLEREFSLYREDSALVRLNRDSHLALPGPEMLALANLVSAAHAASGGRFDPTIQPLWGAYARAGGKPSPSMIEEARSSVGWQRVGLQADRITLPEDGALTFNGIAQGYVTDCIVALLHAEGLRNALVEIGEISALGRTDRGDAWEVRLGSASGPSIPLVDLSVATSAPSGTVFGDGGESHLIDPSTGLPARDSWICTSVIHKSAAIADACSTAACLMTPAEVSAMLRHFDGAMFIGLHREFGTVEFSS